MSHRLDCSGMPAWWPCRGATGPTPRASSCFCRGSPTVWKVPATRALARRRCGRAGRRGAMIGLPVASSTMTGPGTDRPVCPSITRNWPSLVSSGMLLGAPGRQATPISAGFFGNSPAAADLTPTSSLAPSRAFWLSWRQSIPPIAPPRISGAGPAAPHRPSRRRPVPPAAPCRWPVPGRAGCGAGARGDHARPGAWRAAARRAGPPCSSSSAAARRHPVRPPPPLGRKSRPRRFGQWRFA